MAELIRSLARLRSEFYWLAPARDTASDGWIGDAAHQAEKSDHNPDSRGLVHAIDVDDDLQRPGLTMEDVVQFLLARCRSGAEKRITYIIYNRRIWEASNDWRQRTYTGPSPHTEHAHVSGSHNTAREADQSSFHLEELAPVTAPTAAQNAEAVRAVDIDTSAAVQSLGGGILTTLARTGYLANTFAPAVTATLAAIVATLADLNTDNDAIQARLATAQSALDALTSDPEDQGFNNPIVAGAEYAENHEPA